MGHTDEESRPINEPWPLRDRFMPKFEIDPETLCWNWTSRVDSRGYGHMRFGGREMLAHRLAWILFRGEDPGKNFVLHKCDNPLCVNPEHLFLGDAGDNMRDCVAKGRYGKRRFKASWSEIVAMKELRSSMTNSAIAERFGISERQMRRLVKGRNRSHSRPGFPGGVPITQEQFLQQFAQSA
jgi:hypothetical protein